MLGSTINAFNPFNVGHIPSLGTGYGQFNFPMPSPGLFTGQMGMPGMGLGQNVLSGMQQFSMPGMPTIPGIGSSPGLGIGQNIPGVSAYNQHGGMNPQIGSLIGGSNIFGGIGQTPQAFGLPGINPLGGLFGGLNPFNPFSPFNIPALPTFTVHSVAVITPSIDPLAQLMKHIMQAGLLGGGILNPYDPNPLAQLVGQQPWQHGKFGQLNPFSFGAQGLVQPGIQQPYMGARQVVRAYVQTMSGLIPIDLVV
jgi:hypothetical protein